MRNKREFFGLVSVLVICFGVIVYLSSCRRAVVAPGSKPGAVKYEPQQYEIANGSNVIAQVAKDVEFEADVHLADRPEPRRAVVRLKPGTWLMPEQMYTIIEGGEVVCNDRYCEVVQ